MPLSPDDVHRAAKVAGLDGPCTQAALRALQRAELATSGPEGVTRHSPDSASSVPF